VYSTPVPESTLVILNKPTETPVYSTPVPESTLVILNKPTETPAVVKNKKPVIVSNKPSVIVNKTKYFPQNPVVSTFKEKSTKTGSLTGFPVKAGNSKNKKPVSLKNSEISQLHSNGVSFCSLSGYSRELLSNGTQQRFSTCSTTVLGILPSFDNMVSTIILNPANGETINSGSNITIKIQSTGIEYGFFDDPTVSYYVSPQTLNSNGQIQGHNHITIQKLFSFETTPDPRTPVFFKGLNEPSSNGILETEVDGSIFNTTGTYRICTMTSSRSHSAVLMPVARRGSSDDCIRINIV
jgi:hypothetical protein